MIKLNMGFISLSVIPAYLRYTFCQILFL